MAIKTSVLENVCTFLTRTQVGDAKLWAKLTDQFRRRTDKTGEYKGEYWGKIMRGAVLIYRYTRDPKLYEVLEKTVRDMVDICNDGGIRSYSAKCEFTAWDLWCRKYVAVGLEYFYDICLSETLKEGILTALKRHLYAIMDRVGKEEGKIGICDASLDWGGLNSCSILKSFVVGYRLTGEKAFLDFASYIVSTGGSKDFNFVQAAKENVLPLCAYLYPKAYEATSFFEGLIEYGKETGDEEILTACRNYGKALLQQEYTVVGSGGCATECFNYSVLTQTYPRTKPIQETCVTVSYMLYFHELYALTGDSFYLDAMEKSFYNAYLGAMNQAAPHKTRGLPIDWYSPLVGGKRANIINAGRQTFSDGSVYSCCTAIGPAGAGVFAADCVKVSDKTVVFNFYENTTLTVGETTIDLATDYPREGKICLTFGGKTDELTLSFRVPVWCRNYSLSVNGQSKTVEKQNGFITVTEELHAGDIVELELCMAYECVYLGSARFRGGFLYFSRGPIVFAADKRFTKIFRPFWLKRLHEPKLEFDYARQELPDTADAVSVRRGNTEITLVDYASAGNTFDERSRVNVFVPYRTGSPSNVLTCYFDRRKNV